MFRYYALSYILVLIANLAFAAQDESASQDLPASYRDKFLVADPISPNKQFAVIYPRKYVCVEKNNDCQDYLVLLQPFRIVTKLETNSPDFEGKFWGRMSVEWTQDSSVALVTLEAHYGPGDVFLFELRDGKLIRSTNLLNKIRARLEPDYRASKAEPFNDYYGFVLQSVDDSGEEYPGVELKGTTVQVHAYATNDPNMAREKVWKGQFDGVWDIAQGKFTSGKVTRLFAGVRKRD